MRTCERGAGRPWGTLPVAFRWGSTAVAAGALAATSFLLSACDASPAATPVERTDSAGVEIVVSGGGDRPLDWRLEPEFTLGGREEGEQTFYRVTASTVDVDSLGRIHVLDSDNSRIQTFGPGGEFLRSVGGPGEGPGELSRPLGMTVDPGGTLYIHDIGRAGLVRFGPEGEVLEDLRLPFPFFGGRMVGLSGALVMSATPPGSNLGTQVLLRVDASGDTAVLARHSVPIPEGMFQYESCNMGLPAMPPLFAPTLRWHAAGGRLAFTTSTAYDVQVLDEGARRRVRRDVPPMPATREMALASVGEGMSIRTDAGERVCDPEEVVEKRGHGEVVPATGALRVAPDGSLWVARHTVTEDEVPSIDVFDADGAYLGTLPEGTPLPVAFLPDGRPITSETDAFDVQRLVVSRIVRSGEG